ncbi:MAG TPA: helix-turn-helix domain-containing protein [Opitutaceae bacterium]
MKKSGPAAPAPRSPCPLAGSLDIIGDRWTLLVVRDLIWGKARFKEFADSPEGIPTNLLSERLQRLENAGLVERRAYQDNPPRYEYALTPKGRGLKPVLSNLAAWGKRNIPGTLTRDEVAAQAAGAPRGKRAVRR